MQGAFYGRLGILLAVLISSGSICGKSGLIKRNNEKAPIDEYTLGWVDDDTFQIRAKAPHDSQAPAEEERRMRSLVNAELKAQAWLTELLFEAKKRSQASEETASSIAEDIDQIVRSASIVYKKFDSNDGCEIIYRISLPNLRKKHEIVYRELE